MPWEIYVEKYLLFLIAACAVELYIFTEEQKMPPDNKTTCKLSDIDKAQQAVGTNRQWLSGKTASLLLIAGAYGLGGGGMATWLVFLFWGPWIRPTPHFGAAGGLLVDTLLCLLFFIQHSIMVRRRFRLWLIRTVRAELHGALYASVSGACLLVLILFWQPAGPPLWLPPSSIRWAMAGIFLLAVAGAWWGASALGEFDALGIKPALGVFRRRQTNTPMVLTIRGPYRWVRHPLYLFSLIIIWSGPVYTVDRLLHNFLWSTWIVIGAHFEERDLVTCFGHAYRSYRQSVPMLLPKSIRPRVHDRYRPPQNG
jgi:protein-S-isoprenylcysteine O-methyltransferase Ste14